MQCSAKVQGILKAPVPKTPLSGGIGIGTRHLYELKLNKFAPFWFELDCLCFLFSVYCSLFPVYPRLILDLKLTKFVCFRFELEATSDTKTRAGKYF